MSFSLAAIFHGNTGYLNQETTLPACVAEEPIYKNPLLDSHPELFQEVRELLRVIIHPNAVDIQKETARNMAKILESPYECGRVLESPNRILVDGTAYTLNVKGVGTTRFYRETQAINPWQWWQFSKNAATTKAMQTRTFHEDRWVFHKADALMNMEWFYQLQTFGVETEIPLAIYGLVSLPDKNGEMQSIEKLKKKWHLHKDVEPVLYVRMSRTNFRFLDPIRMNKSEEFRPFIQPLFKHILSEYRDITKKSAATMQEYIEWVIRKMVSQEICLVMNGIYHGWETWPDFGRNISMFGEIVDLDDTRNHTTLGLRNVRDLMNFLENRTELLISNTRQFINAFIESEEQIDIPSIARIFIDTIYETCLKNIWSLDIKEQPYNEEIPENSPERYLERLAHNVRNYTWCDHEKNTLQNDMKEYLEKNYDL